MSDRVRIPWCTSLELLPVRTSLGGHPHRPRPITASEFPAGGLTALRRYNQSVSPLRPSLAPLSDSTRALTATHCRRPRQARGPLSTGGQFPGSPRDHHLSGGLVSSPRLTPPAEASFGRGRFLEARLLRRERDKFS
ncbi:hypothetical protein NDU88_001109 [Pleurodeles waltl]|uniref:Uncharacterized protein n=1 Tax=Pleurodeles waltl TaxID=8319 RepID=A0AAV7WHE2_PLEWA|nr:hypothetical protein NDU88_001108 [Pleurodeles waltl]KAJ1213472.1 hypothetical protein NDU88_001109 [Pleurodeles waltl]